MNRDRAIEILIGLQDGSGSEYEAVRLAIEALQTPPITQRSMYQAGYRQGREEALKTVIVRCGECKHMMADGRCEVFADDAIRPSASDFCSYGERREE